MKPTPLRWWSRSDLDVVAGAIAPAWQRWCADWDVPTGLVIAGNACESGSDDRSRIHWHVCDRSEDARSWLGFAGMAPTAAMTSLMFGAPPVHAGRDGPTIAAEVAGEAWNDLCRALASGLSTPLAAKQPVNTPAATAAEASTPPASDWRPWSGAISIRLADGTAAAPLLILQLSPAAAGRLVVAHRVAPIAPAHAAPKLQPLAEAIDRKVVRLSVELSGMTLDLGTLQSLRAGDVLALSHRLDHPLQVSLHSAIGGRRVSTALCAGLLGARGDRRAVELLRDPVLP